MTTNTQLETAVQTVFRRGGWITAVAALLVGAFGLIFPVAALKSIALLFGIYLILAGAGRVYTAITARTSRSGWRWFVGAVGVVVIAAGVLCFLDPFASLLAVEMIIGIGWMLDGVTCFVAAFSLFRRGTRLALVITGVVSFLFGLVLLLVPGVALLSFLFLAAIFLVVIGVVGIAGLLISGARIREGAAKAV